MLLAAKIGAGGLGFLVVLLLIAAAVVIFIAMSGSLKRLRRSVDSGEFEHHVEEQAAQVRKADDDAGTSGEAAVSRDPSGRGGAAS